MGSIFQTTANGCGVGRAVLPPSFMLHEACVAHDDCYARCGASKLICDAQF